MAGHTPGPYVAHGREDGRGTSWTVGRAEPGFHFTLARIFRPQGDGSEVTKANALLFAAAPDLLEALQGLLAVSEMTTFSDQYPAQSEAARAAIAHATGEQP